MRKTITSILAFVATMFVTNAVAQNFTASVEEYPASDYSGKTVTLSLTEIATALETDTATLAAALDAWYENPDSVEPMAHLSFTDSLGVARTDTTYTQGTAGGFWMDAYGASVTWGSGYAAWYEYLSWNVTKDAFSIYIGQYPDVAKAGDKYTSNLVLTFKGKTATIALQLNVVARPELGVDQVGYLSKITVVDSMEVDVHEYLRSNYGADAFYFNVKGIAEKLGVDPEVMNVDFSQMLYAKTYDTSNEVINDSLTNTFTATAPGFWYQGTFDSEKGEDSPECAQCTYAVDGCKLFIESIAYDQESDTISAKIGQYPDAMKEGETSYASFYVLYGTKAVKFTVNLTIDEQEVSPFTSMTKCGEVSLSLDKYVSDLGDYAQGTITMDVDSVAALMGTTAANMELKALADAESLSTNTTANNGGYWVDENSYVCSWGTTAIMYIEPTTSQDYSTYTVGQYPGHITDPGTYTCTLYLTAGDKYVELKFNLNVLADPVGEYTVETCQTVATKNYTYQIVPNSSYQDYTYMDASIDADIDWITSLVGSSASLYAEQYSSDGTLTYSKTYTCTPYPGFWMGPDPSGNEHRSSASSWGSTNTYGICYASGAFQFFQYPSSSSAVVGNYFKDNYYLVNLEEGKKIQFTFTVKYVSEIVPEAEIAKTIDVVTPTCGETSGDGAYTTVDMDAVFEALGCTAEEFSEGGTWLAPDQNGTYSSANYDEQEGFFFDADGKTVDDGTEVMHVGYNADENKFFSWVLDEANQSKTYNVTIHAVYNGICVEFNITVGGSSDAIKNITTSTSKKSAVYDMSGRALKSANKGLYIQNGKKYLVK